jgi:hypothetical protein
MLHSKREYNITLNDLIIRPAHAIALYTPTMLREDMGFSVTHLLCLTAPPQIAVIIVAMIIAY